VLFLLPNILFVYRTGIWDRWLAPDVSLMDFINYRSLHMLVWLWILHLSFMLSWVILVLPRCNSLFQVCLMYLVYCESCQLGKHIRSSFPSSVSQRTSSPFALVHSNIWEPSRIKSNLGFQYFVTFIDDYSRCTWVFLKFWVVFYISNILQWN